MKPSLRSTLAALLVTASTVAAAPDGATVIRQMKAALEPPQSSIRKVVLTVTSPGIPGPLPTKSTVLLGQARGRLGESDRILTVVLAPGGLRGMAYLVQQQVASDTDVQWAYIPAIGRVRQLISPEAFSAFLNSDFTFSDLGFVSLRQTYTVKGAENGTGGTAYRINGLPKQRYYYSHIETLVNAGASMPVEQKFYDPAGALWKVARYERVVTIEGVPTIVEVSMDDVQSRSKSTLTVTDLDYGAKVPDDLLKPEGLPGAASWPLWETFSAPVAR